MLSKPAALLMRIIYEKPINAYEMIKLLDYINIKWWFNISDSTVYVTLRNLEKKGLIKGKTEKVGNMPDRTIYSLTESGENELKETIKEFILQFSYDTNVFTMAAFIMDIIEAGEKKELLEKRLNILQSVAAKIEKQGHETCKYEEPALHSVNLNRMIDIVNAEISETERLLSIYENY